MTPPITPEELNHPADAERQHVPHLEQKAYNPRPKSRDWVDLRLIHYVGTDLYQWFGKHNGSVFEDQASEPFVMRQKSARQSLDEGGWRDIASAPRDGARFIGATPFSTALPGHEQGELTPPWRYAVMWWDEQFEAVGWDDGKDDTIYRGAWSAGRVASWGYQEYAEETPTHWIPLPAPPQAQEG